MLQPNVTATSERILHSHPNEPLNRDSVPDTADPIPCLVVCMSVFDGQLVMGVCILRVRIARVAETFGATAILETANDITRRIEDPIRLSQSILEENRYIPLPYPVVTRT